MKYKHDVTDFFAAELERLGIPLQEGFVDLSPVMQSVNDKFNRGAYRLTRRDAQKLYDEMRLVKTRGSLDLKCACG